MKITPCGLYLMLKVKKELGAMSNRNESKFETHWKRHRSQKGGGEAEASPALRALHLERRGDTEELTARARQTLEWQTSLLIPTRAWLLANICRVSLQTSGYDPVSFRFLAELIQMLMALAARWQQSPELPEEDDRAELLAQLRLLRGNIIYSTWHVQIVHSHYANETQRQKPGSGFICELIINLIKLWRQILCS